MAVHSVARFPAVVHKGLNIDNVQLLITAVKCAADSLPLVGGPIKTIAGLALAIIEVSEVSCFVHTISLSIYPIYNSFTI